jgi:hypothetical protein
MDTQTVATTPADTATATPKADKPRKVMAGYIHETEVAVELGCKVRTVRGFDAPHIVLNREKWFPEAEFRQWLRKRTRTPRG